MDPYVQYLHEIAGGMQRFVQPDIDLAMRVLGLPSEIIRQQAEGPLTTALGPTGGRTMADALSQVLGPMMMIPEGAGRSVGPIAPRRAVPETTPYPRSRTAPLPEIVNEPRFHGSLRPIREIRTPFGSGAGDDILDSAASAYENLYGPGFYTTNNYHVARGYSGAERAYPFTGATYRVYEINPVKFLSGEGPLSQSMHDRILKTLGISVSTPRNFFEYGRFHTVYSPGEAVNKFVQAAQEEGYGGIDHIGGANVGDQLHRVKIYWNPARDIRVRPTDFERWRKGDVAPPTIGK